MGHIFEGSQTKPCRYKMVGVRVALDPPGVRGDSEDEVTWIEVSKGVNFKSKVSQKWF